ncbi:hypothetical protein ACJX0J_016298 [Zea mays]
MAEGINVGWLRTKNPALPHFLSLLLLEFLLRILNSNLRTQLTSLLHHEVALGLGKGGPLEENKLSVSILLSKINNIFNCVDRKPVTCLVKKWSLDPYVWGLQANELVVVLALPF